MGTVRVSIWNTNPTSRPTVRILFAPWWKPSYGEENSPGLTHCGGHLLCFVQSAAQFAFWELPLPQWELAKCALPFPNWEMVIVPKSGQSHSSFWDFESWIKFIYPVIRLSLHQFQSMFKFLRNMLHFTFSPQGCIFFFITFSFMS